VSSAFPVATASRVESLIAAHRAAQIDRRAALAMENRRALLAADRRATAVAGALTSHGKHAVAEALVAELRSGDALLVALTCESATPHEVDVAMANYQSSRHRVTVAASS
jgi:hypothetical protein